MYPIRKISRYKLHVGDSPSQVFGNKLTSEDIARVHERRAEFRSSFYGIGMVGSSRAESEFNLWLRDLFSRAAPSLD